MEKILLILAELGLPFAYDHFAEGESPDPPYTIYLLPESNNFSADGKVYHKKSEIRIELYTDIKDIDLEEQLESILDKYEMFYNKSEVWIEEENLYEVLYIMEV